jgi:hypothetical protein
MLIVRGTKKLRDKVKVATPPDPTDESTTELGDWFATALFWKPHVALLVNTRTFLPLFMPLAPAPTLLDRIPDAITDVLRRHMVPDDVIARELEAMSDVRLTMTNDRQVVGVMNELVFQAEGLRDDRNPDLVGLSMTLSSLILGPLKRHDTPAAELAALLNDDATIIPFPTRADQHTDASAPSGGRVHQLKVTLKGTKPPIWRRVFVDGGQTLHHLHDVIQAAFGWYDSHLHDFEVGNRRYGIPHKDDRSPVSDERRVSLDQVISAGKLRYTYDFGDNWEHDIIVEKTLDADDSVTVPDCIGGRRATPPEDCGGPWGYAEFLGILADPNHPEYDERLEWIGQPLDPDAFDPSEFADNLRHQQAPRPDNWFD